MKKSIIAVALAILGTIGAVRAATPARPPAASCCDGGRCCDGEPCCGTR